MSDDNFVCYQQLLDDLNSALFSFNKCCSVDPNTQWLRGQQKREKLRKFIDSIPLERMMKTTREVQEAADEYSPRVRKRQAGCIFENLDSVRLNHIAKEAGLSPRDQSIFFQFMIRAFPEGADEYWREWAKRFKEGKAWQYLDIEHRRILEQITHGRDYWEIK